MVLYVQCQHHLTTANSDILKTEMNQCIAVKIVWKRWKEIANIEHICFNTPFGFKELLISKWR